MLAMFASSSVVATAIRLVQFLLAATMVVAVARDSSPLAHVLLQVPLAIVTVKAIGLDDQEVITNNQQSRRACVYGSPKEYDQWTIYYHEVKPPSQFPNHFVLDPAWVASHQTVGDTDVSALSFTCHPSEDDTSSNKSSISPWAQPGCHGPRIGASILATREKIAFLLPDPRVRHLKSTCFAVTKLTPFLQLNTPRRMLVNSIVISLIPCKYTIQSAKARS
jgi:hypothetical protein